MAKTDWGNRFLRASDASLSPFWRPRVVLKLAGLLAALLFGAAIERGRAALEILGIGAIAGLGLLYVWVQRRRAIAARRRAPPPLDLPQS